jgi:ectoine hydroxylase-related dioxygenase (phytanoyl-CoA dioxygenase family)
VGQLSNCSKQQMDNLKLNFERDGFVILPKFYSDTDVDVTVGAVRRRKFSRSLDVVVDMLDTGERTVLGLLSPEDLTARRMKINDLYLDTDEVRTIALGKRLAPILKELLGDTPVLCNSLYLEKGSAQRPHVDAIYMTPRTPNHLIASWVALEDAHTDAGPLEYFAASHLIEQMTFSNGTYHNVPEEMDRWEAYMASEVQRRQLKKHTFAARKGDVFIWHSNLLHGGGEIKNHDLTRMSLIFHYFSATDSIAQGLQTQPLSGACWWVRSPQPVGDHILQRMPFSEEAYLSRYPDVFDAVKSGLYASGRQHYEQHGRSENRIPGKSPGVKP